MCPRCRQRGPSYLEVSDITFLSERLQKFLDKQSLRVTYKDYHRSESWSGQTRLHNLERQKRLRLFRAARAGDPEAIRALEQDYNCRVITP